MTCSFDDVEEASATGTQDFNVESENVDNINVDSETLKC